MGADRVDDVPWSAENRPDRSDGQIGTHRGNRVDGLGPQAAGAAQQAYGRAMDQLRDVADRAASYAEAAYDQGRRTLETRTREVNDRIEANPVMAIVMAGFLGCLLGIARGLGRRR